MAARKSKAPRIETETEDKGATKILDQGARDFVNCALLFEKVREECHEDATTDFDHIEALAEAGKTFFFRCGDRLGHFAHPEAQIESALGDEASSNTASAGALIAKRIRRAVYLAQTALIVCEPSLDRDEVYAQSAALISRSVALEAIDKAVLENLDALDAALGVTYTIDLDAMYCAREFAGTDTEQ